MSKPTRFIESNALLAIHAEDERSAIFELTELTLPELLALRKAAYRLAELCTDEILSKGVEECPSAAT